MISLESHHHISYPPEEVWPILSNTDWLNRAIGLPPVKYEFEKRPEGGSTVMASAKFLGSEWRWRELPFEWSKPEYYRVRRIYQNGLFREALVGLDFKRTEKGTRVGIVSHILPRNGVSRFLIKRIVCPKATRDTVKAISHVESYLKGKAAIVLPKLTVQPVNEGALVAALRKLRATGLPEANVALLEEWLRKAPDIEMSHMRPFAMARKWDLDRWDVLRLFLHGTRCGLLDLSWEILCPNCRTARQQISRSLSELAREAHCDVCQIKYDAEFDKSVELKFSVNPSIRKADGQTFCLAGPGGKPHIIGQAWLEPKEERAWRVPELSHPVRLQSTQLKESLLLQPEQLSNLQKGVELVCEAEGFKLQPQSEEKQSQGVRIFNPNPFGILVSVETVDWNSEILTAARATNWQEFRDLFVNEVISPNEKISIGSQVIMFTDLRGSTAVYQNVGDAVAYSMVRDHFSFMIELISAHHGTVVKTMGDAVMAVFSQLDDALNAAKSIHIRFFDFKHPATNAASRQSLALKTAMHIGPCLAVNANGQIDYFGSTVNLAARLVSSCKGNDLAFSDEIITRPEMLNFLKQFPVPPEASEIRFRGFDSPHRVWRLEMI